MTKAMKINSVSMEAAPRVRRAMRSLRFRPYIAYKRRIRTTKVRVSCR